MTETIRIGLLGYGGVGRAFWNVLAERRDALHGRYGLAFEIALVRRSSSQAEPAGGAPNPARWAAAEDVGTSIRRLRLDVVVQAVPSDAARTAIARDQILDSFAAGADVVTATKSPLVVHWEEIETAAIGSGRCIRISAAAGAALPAVDLSRRALRALPCESVRASLNGTTNFVLEKMSAGASRQEAVDLAVAAGICEPNPDDDLSGRDSAMKIVLLSNLIWGWTHGLSDVSIEHDLIESRLAAAAASGRVVRSIAIARPSAAGPQLEVSLCDLDPQDPLAQLKGAEKGIEFDCGRCGSVLATGGRSSPEGAAFALLKDLVNLATGDRSAGFG